MRLWSVNPEYLDTRGLVALWREGLLAQKVLMGQTRGYKHHPQLKRFKECQNTLGVMSSYLAVVQQEAEVRGYRFDKSKLVNPKGRSKLAVTQGQLEYEFSHLMNKLKQRDEARYHQLKFTRVINPHPLFKVIEGDIEPWEVVE